MDGHAQIEEGDIVDHKLFGLGKVLSVEGKDSHQYRVTVAWGDPGRKDSTVMGWALKKVASPDVRPFVYWDKQWQVLRKAWLDARRKVELHCQTFDPEPDKQALAKAISAETGAWDAMVKFLESPRT